MSTQTIPQPAPQLEQLQATLKPCPFCGGRAELRVVTEQTSPEGGFCVAACDLNNTCAVYPSAGGETLAAAAQAWNHRAGIQPGGN